MAAFVAFVGMLLLSLVASLIAALQLGDFFGANEEFVLMLGYQLVFAVAALAIFAAGYWHAPSVGVLNLMAFVLAMLTLVPPIVPGFVQAIAERSTNPFTVGIERTYIRLELVVPAMLTVLVQWGLVRGRWLRAAGEVDLTLWPWVTTVITGLVILNPFGLTFLTATIKHSPGDLMWQPIAIATAGVLAALLVMACAECYIRNRILDRRMAAAAPDRGGTVKPD